VTASNSMVSQASQVMRWDRVDLYRLESSEGYQIVAMRIVNGGWVYLASGPKEKLTQNNGRLFFRGIEYKARYQQGEQVPPMYSYRGQTARQYIGHFHQSAHGTTDAALAAAKSACDQDLADQILTGPSQGNATRAQNTA